MQGSSSHSAPSCSVAYLLGVRPVMRPNLELPEHGACPVCPSSAIEQCLHSGQRNVTRRVCGVSACHACRLNICVMCVRYVCGLNVLTVYSVTPAGSQESACLFLWGPLLPTGAHRVLLHLGDLAHLSWPLPSASPEKKAEWPFPSGEPQVTAEDSAHKTSKAMSEPQGGRDHVQQAPGG